MSSRVAAIVQGHLPLNNPSDQLSPRTRPAIFDRTFAPMPRSPFLLTLPATILSTPRPSVIHSHAPFLFRDLQIPCPVIPLYSHRYKSPGGVASACRVG